MFSHIPGKNVLFLLYGFSCASVGYGMHECFYKTCIRVCLISNSYFCFLSYDYPAEMISRIAGDFLTLLVLHCLWNILMNTGKKCFPTN